MLNLEIKSKIKADIHSKHMNKKEYDHSVTSTTKKSNNIIIITLKVKTHYYILIKGLIDYP